MKILKFFTSLIIFTIMGVILLLIIFTPPKCEHREMGKRFSFQSLNSTATSTIKPYCKNCNHSFGYTRFKGTPDDTSYLEVVCEHSNVDEIIGGEYYTMTAFVALGDYEFNKTKIICRVENEDITVAFSVEFRAEFEEEVGVLEEGDEVTFYGRFYDTGCGFTDCELIN